MEISFRKVRPDILNVEYREREDCYTWGRDNAFPSMLETLINGSVTAGTCVDKVSKAIFGKGFGEEGNFKVNQKQTLNKVLQLAARIYAKQNNVFLHLRYNMMYEIVSVKVISPKFVRYASADDNEYSGKMIIYNNWDMQLDSSINVDKFKYVDVYDPRPEVIAKQIEAVKGIENYNGQILHIQKDEENRYAMSDYYKVLKELLIENKSQVFRNNGIERGFLNNKLLARPPYADDDEKKAFKKSIDELSGADGAGKIAIMTIPMEGDDVNKQFAITDLSGSYNDKLFAYTDEQAEKNICKAASVPLILVAQNDSSIFGNSGELLKQARLQLWQDKELERLEIQNIFNDVMNHFIHKPNNTLIIQSNE